MKHIRTLTLAVIALAAAGLRADTASPASNKNADTNAAQTNAAPAAVAKAEPQRLLLSQDESIEGKLNANVLLINQGLGEDVALAAISKTTGRTYAKATDAQIAAIKEHGMKINAALGQWKFDQGIKQLHVVSTAKVAMNGASPGQAIASNGSAAPTAAASP